MKNPSRHSITKELKKRVPMLIALLAAAGMVALNLCVPEPVTKPDVEYPMANAHITWEESFHSGAWSDAE